MATTPKVRNTIAKKVLQELKQAGMEETDLLAKTGLQIHQLNKDDGWVPFISHASLLELGAHELDDPLYGMHMALKTDPRDYGALAYIGLSSRTLGDALANLERYVSVVTEAWKIELIREDRSLIVERIPANSNFHQYRQAAEFSTCGLIHAYQMFAAQSLAPKEICFVHTAPPSYKDESFADVLACPVKFGQKRARIVLDASQLELPITSADDRLLDILRSYCDEAMKQAPQAQTDLATNIRQKVIDLLPTGRATARTIANELGLTERTMHRRLARERVKFTEIHEGIRRELASRYIAREDLTLQQIAFLLGYAGQSAFSVAFKRWTGLAPKEARAVQAG